MIRIIGIISRIAFSGIAILIGLYYIYHSTFERANTSLSPSEDKQVDLADAPQIIKDDRAHPGLTSINEIGFRNRTEHAIGSVQQVLDSIRAIWSSGQFQPVESFDIQPYKLLNEPIIESHIEKSTGYLGYTLIYVGQTLSPAGIDSISGVYIFNRTILGVQESDSGVALNICETPQPIEWIRFCDWVQMPVLADSEYFGLLPCAGGRSAFQHEMAGMPGRVWAWWFPCPVAEVIAFFNNKLADVGWRRIESNQNQEVVFLRNSGQSEALAFSCLGTAQDSCCMAIFSYEGANNPFQAPFFSHPRPL